MPRAAREISESGRYTDMRKGIDGLAAMIQGQLRLNPFDKSLYLFCGRNRSKMKGLLWEGDGFLLLYKRLENGSFRWPCNETEAKKLTPQQIRWLFGTGELALPLKNE